MVQLTMGEGRTERGNWRIGASIKIMMIQIRSEFLVDVVIV